MGSAFSNPSGSVVVSGKVSFSSAPKALQINQTSDKAIVNWQDFSIGEQEITKIVQPNSRSSILNRVVGGNISQIYGSLQANGQVFLLNPQGLLIGPKGSITTGSFVFSALHLSNENFLDSNLSFDRGTNSAFVNLGTIRAQTGDIYVLARTIENKGRLIASEGKVGLCGATEVVLAENGHNAFVRLAGEGTVSNEGVIEAAASEIRAAGENIFGCAINQSGEIFATRAVRKNGKIMLVAKRGLVEMSGKIEAKGGEVQVMGDHIALKGEIDVSHVDCGGTVLVGGDLHGAALDGRNAETVYMAPEAKIKACAVKKGDGGKVVLWAEQSMWFDGAIDIGGGAKGGDGGFAEVSGRQGFHTGGSVNAIAPFGKVGTLLYDPWTLTVTEGADSNVTLSGGIYYPTATGANLSRASIETALLSADLQVNTSGGGGAEAGDITISGIDWSIANPNSYNLTFTSDQDILLSGNLTWTSGGTLKLDAGRRLYINANITSTAAGTISLNNQANASGNFTGIYINTGKTVSATAAGSVEVVAKGLVGTITSEYGALYMLGNISVVNGDLFITATGSVLSTSARQHGIFINNGSITSSGSGNITITGTAGSNNIDTYGVYLINSSANITSSGTGLITMNCYGSPVAGATNTLGLILNHGARIVSSAAAGINIIARASLAASSGYGIRLVNALSYISCTNPAATLNISITDSNAAGTFYGLRIDNTSYLLTANGAGITISASATAADYAVYLLNNAYINPGTGALSITGTRGSFNLASAGSGGNQVNAGSGTLSLIGDSFAASSGNIAGTGALLIKPYTTTGALSLSDSFLARLATGYSAVSFGSLTDTGSLTVGVKNFSAYSADVVIQGGAISLNGNLTMGANNLTVYGNYNQTIASNISGITVNKNISTTTGNIELVGKGGNSAGNYGVFMTGTSVISSTGSGTITLTGTGGSGNTCHGIVIDTAGVQITSSSTGTITLTGTGGTGGAGSHGIVFDTGIVIAATSSVGITLNATGGSGAASYGLYGSGTAAVSTAGGLFEINAATNNSSATPHPLVLQDTASLASDSGAINITATANGSGTSTALLLMGASSITTESGAITIEGVSQGGLSSKGVGMYTTGSITATAAGGSITITASNPNTASATNPFTMSQSSHINATTGDITVTATSGTTSQSDIVMNNSSYMQTTTGNIILNCISNSPTLRSDGNGGGNVLECTTGNITITGNSFHLNETIGTGNFSSTGILTIQPYSTSSAMAVGGAADTVSSAEMAYFSAGFSSLIFGRSNTTGTMTCNAYALYSDPVTFRGRTITLGGALVSSGDITFQTGRGASGGMSFNRSVTADNLTVACGSSGDAIVITTTPTVTTMFTMTSGSASDTFAGSGTGDTTLSIGGDVTIGGTGWNFSNAGGYAFSLTSGTDLFISGPITDAAAGSLTLAGGRRAYIDANITNSGSGTVILQNNASAVGNYSGIEIASGRTISATGSGALSITANGLNTATINMSALHINGATLSVVNGNLTINATGNIAASNTNHYGVYLQAGSIVSTGSGNISITATGGSTGSNGCGIYQYGSIINQSGSGNISITATGSSVSALNYGLRLGYDGVTVTHITSGASSSGCAINSNIGDIASNNTSYGVYLVDSCHITSAAGTLSITANDTSAYTAGGGIFLTGSSCYATGTGSAAVTVSTSSKAAAHSLYLNASSFITTAAGTITIAAAAVDTGSAIKLGAGAHINSTAGIINIGSIATPVSSNNADTISMISSGAYIRTTGGALTIVATSTGAGAYSALRMGTAGLASANITATDGAINITATCTNSTDAALRLEYGSVIYTTGASSGSVTLKCFSSGATDIDLEGASYIKTSISPLLLECRSAGLIFNSTGNPANLSQFYTGSGTLTIKSNAFAVANGYITGTGALSIQPYTASDSFSLPTAALGLFNTGFSSFTIGLLAGTGQVTVGAKDFSGYSCDIILQGGSVVINGNLTMGARGLTVYGNYNKTVASDIVGITVNNNISTTTGAIVLNGKGGNSASDYGVFVTGIAQITSSGSGAITITGIGGPSNTCHGVRIDTAGVLVRATGTGNISITGTGGSGGAGSHGILVSEGGIVETTGEATITMNGTGGGTATGSGGVMVSAGGIIRSTASAPIIVTGTGASGTGACFGINMTGATSTCATNTGKLTLSGTGAGTGIGSYGVDLAGVVQATGAGIIEITGTGAVGTNDNYGLKSAVDITSAGGGITLTGLGKGTGQGGYGVFLDGCKAQTTGTGVITIIGTGSASGTSDCYGVRFSGALGGAQTANGRISITGTGGGSTTGGYGVYIDTGAIVRATGSGAITLTGSGGSGTDNNYGIGLSGLAAHIISASGRVTTNGVGGGSGSGCHGIYADGAAYIESTGGGTLYFDSRAGWVGTGFDIYFAAGTHIGNAASASPIIFNENTVEILGTLQGTGSLTFIPRSNTDMSLGTNATSAVFKFDDAKMAAIATGFASVTFGSSSNNGTIYLNYPNSFNLPLYFYSNNFILEGTLTAGTNPVQINVAQQGVGTCSLGYYVGSGGLTVNGGPNNSAIYVGLKSQEVTVDGQGGSNTMQGADVDKTWTLTANNAGTVSNAVFANMQNLLGGSGNDTFNLLEYSVSGTINGGGGATNLLSYVGDNQVVYVDTATGKASQTGGIANIQGIAGGDGNKQIDLAVVTATVSIGTVFSSVTGGGGMGSFSSFSSSQPIGSTSSTFSATTSSSTEKFGEMQVVVSDARLLNTLSKNIKIRVEKTVAPRAAPIKKVEIKKQIMPEMLKERIETKEFIWKETEVTPQGRREEIREEIFIQEEYEYKKEEK